MMILLFFYAKIKKNQQIKGKFRRRRKIFGFSVYAANIFDVNNIIYDIIII